MSISKLSPVAFATHWGTRLLRIRFREESVRADHCSQRKYSLTVPNPDKKEPSKELFNCPHEDLTRGGNTALFSPSAHPALALESLISTSCISLLVLLNTVEMSITAEQSLWKNWILTLNSSGGFCHYFPTKKLLFLTLVHTPQHRRFAQVPGDRSRGTDCESFSRLLPAWSREQ